MVNKKLTNNAYCNIITSE